MKVYHNSFLPSVFHLLSKKMMDEHTKILSDYGLTKAHLPILMMLVHHQEGMYQSELAREVFFDRAHVSRMLKELLNRKFVYQEDTNTYKNRYFIASKGIEVTKAIKETSDRVRQRLLDSVSKEEMVEFERIIKKMIDAF